MTAQEVLADAWFSTDLSLGEEEVEEGSDLADVDLSAHLPALVRFQLDQLSFFSQWVVTKKLEFSKVGRFREEHVLAAF